MSATPVNNVVDKNRPWTLTAAGWLLILFGVLETIFLIALIQSGKPFRFSGGLILNIWIGTLLLQKDPKPYTYVVGLSVVYSTLVLTGILFVGIQELHFHSAKESFSQAISITKAEEGNWMARFFLIYSLILPVILFLLYHPETRHSLNIETKNKNRFYTLFLSSGKRALLLIIIGTSAFAGLLGGPHLFRNPYPLIIAKLTDPLEPPTVLLGAIQRLELTSRGEHNWFFSTTWSVIGEDKTGSYKVTVSPQHKASIQPQLTVEK